MNEDNNANLLRIQVSHIPRSLEKFYSLNIPIPSSSFYSHAMTSFDDETNRLSLVLREKLNLSITHVSSQY